MDRNFAMEFVRVTEAAALSSSRLVGFGDEKAADQAAVDAMRKALDSMKVSATVVIGEGERDEAPMLYIGEKVGCSDSPRLDLALDPLEGTTITARGDHNAMSVIAITDQGGFLHCPDTYMEKIAVGPMAKDVIDITRTPTDNLNEIAKRKRVDVRELTAIILDRPRHKDLIDEVRSVGARIIMIRDGDISAAISTCHARSGADVLFGIGGAPEGVIAAAALRCLGGDIQGRLKFRNEEEIKRAKVMGITDLNRIYRAHDLAQGNVLFCATGVTDGTYLDGVKFIRGGALTHSVVMRYESGTIREIRAEHRFIRKPGYHNGEQ